MLIPPPPTELSDEGAAKKPWGKPEARKVSYRKRKPWTKPRLRAVLFAGTHGGPTIRGTWQTTEVVPGSPAYIYDPNIS